MSKSGLSLLAFGRDVRSQWVLSVLGMHQPKDTLCDGAKEDTHEIHDHADLVDTSTVHAVERTAVAHIRL
eukprot:3844215-Prymnesium_polylepis.1